MGLPRACDEVSGRGEALLGTISSGKSGRNSYGEGGAEREWLGSQI